jgi:hypothetical protein
MAQRLGVYTLLAAVLLAWSACGVAQEAKDRIAFQRDGLHAAPTNVVVMFADGSEPKDLNTDAKELAGARITPALAPDGRTLAFAAKKGNQYKLYVWTLNEQNEAVGEPHQLTTNDDTTDKFPVWSPDGKTLAYIAIDTTEKKTTLRTIGADGAGMKVLADINTTAAPAWKPDGMSLLYIDLDKSKPVLRNIMASGGLPFAIRDAMPIHAASYAPDGLSIAVLVRCDDGTSDLWTIPAIGNGGSKKIVSKIFGGRSVHWFQQDTVLFNATKVGTQAGKGLWKVGTGGAGLTQIPAYANASQVANFSVGKGDVGGVPETVDPFGGPGPNGPGAGDNVPKGPITITRPLDNATVRGVVSVKIIAQKQIASMVLRINNEFAYATTTTAGDDETTQLTYRWETQAFQEFDPSRKDGLPARYRQALRYPDGDYTLRVIGLDKDSQAVADHTVKVTVANTLADSEMPPNLALKLRFPEGGGDSHYYVHGEGSLYGVSAKTYPSLVAKFDGLINRNIIEVKPNGNAELRTRLRDIRGQLPLTYGLKISDVPETDTSALYTLTPFGELTVIPQLRQKVLLPISQVTLPLPSQPVSMGYQWSAEMRVVVDLLERCATKVRANNTVDGLEFINGKRTVRIRTELNIDPIEGADLATAPVSYTPGLRGVKPTAPTTGGGMAGMPTGMPAATPAADTGTSTTPAIKPTATAGVRFTWFDIERNAIVRVEDMFLYTFPASSTAAAGSTPATGGAPNPFGMGGNPAPPPAGGGAPNPFGDMGGAPAGGGVVDDPFGGGAKPITPKAPAKTPDAFYLVRYSYRVPGEEEAEK